MLYNRFHYTDCPGDGNLWDQLAMVVNSNLQQVNSHSNLGETKNVIGKESYNDHEWIVF